MTRHIFTNATAVLPDRVLEDATLVAEDGLIVEIDQTHRDGGTDLRGALLLPGLVDSHSDGLERDLRPRPGAEMEPAFAVISYEGRARAAGVTTVFHGIGYQENPRKERSIEQAQILSRALESRSASGSALIDHRLLLRLDARAPGALEALKSAVDHICATSDIPPLVSFEDHTPGQGQYADVKAFRRAVGAQLDDAAADAHIQEVISHREGLAWHRDIAIGYLSEQALSGRIRLLAHDATSAEEIALRCTQGTAVAEFPTTMEAALAAREQGLLIVAGAPNILRGQSHSGNISATELITAGLVDGLASDYMPSTLLAAVTALALRSVVELPAAVALATSGGARVGGLDDRGRLAVGARSDLVVATLDGEWPTVRTVLLAEEQREQSRYPVGALAVAGVMPGAGVTAAETVGAGSLA